MLRMTVGGVPAGRRRAAGSRTLASTIDSIGLGRLAAPEFEGEFGVGQHRGDLFHPLQRLDPALRLLGLAGLGLEAVDELLQGAIFRPVWPLACCSSICSARMSSKVL